MDYDCIVIGSGLAGSVVARHVAEQMNKRVLLIERRDHIGGNMFDYTDANGIIVHKYGPHLFHTNNIELVRYLRRFGNWRDFKVKCMAFLDGKFTPTPFNFQTIDDYYDAEEAQNLKNRLLKSYGFSSSAPITELLQNDDPIIHRYAEFLFEKDYRPYTAKQWGMPASEIAPSVLGRVPIRFSYNADRFEDDYQLLPTTSYADFFRELLNHPNIVLRMGENALDSVLVDIDNCRMLYGGEPISIPVVFTGSLDELFGYKYGSLPYRSLRIEMRTISGGNYQPVPIVAYPQVPDYIRITEYGKLSESSPEDVSTIAVEYSVPFMMQGEDEPYYIICTETSEKAAARYKAEASRISNLFLCGRLAEYKYYDMDEVLASAVRMGKSLESYIA